MRHTRVGRQLRFVSDWLASYPAARASAEEIAAAYLEQEQLPADDDAVRRLARGLRHLLPYEA